MHKLGNNESYNNVTFRNETDTSIIVRLKCPSYCQLTCAGHYTAYIVFL